MPRHATPSLDLERHLKQWWRDFLPIFAVTGGALIVAFAVWGPGKRSEADPAMEKPARVGLLAVEGAEGEFLPFDPAFVVIRPLDLVRAPVAARFDAPMGSPHGALTYNAQPFLVTRHLGDDLNGIGGRNSDLGDPVYAAGDGEAIFSGWAGEGWGLTVILLHRLPDGTQRTTLYGHLDQVRLPAGATVRRGERLGKVGNAGGKYLAHLHFEVRPAQAIDPGPGYGDGSLGRQSGEVFLKKWRGALEDRQNSALGGPWDTRMPGSQAEPSLRIVTPLKLDSEPLAIPRPAAK